MNDFPIKPLEDRLVVQKVEQDTTTASGLFVPETAHQGGPREGVVLAVGPGRYENGTLIPPTVSVGDRVLYAQYGGTEIQHKGEDYVVLTASQVFAVIE